MTLKIVTEILGVLEDQRKAIKGFFDELTNDELNWKPQENRNSIANLIEHITAAEAFWIQQGILGQKVDREREKEFEYRYRSSKELQNAYNYMRKATRHILENKITDNDLFEKRKVRNTEKTVLWILLHMVEHNYYHIGQMMFIRALLRDTSSLLDRPKKH